MRDIIDKLNATLMKVSKANSMDNLIQQITVKSAAAGGIYTWLDSKQILFIPRIILRYFPFRYIEIPHGVLGSETQANGSRCRE